MSAAPFQSGGDEAAPAFSTIRLLYAIEHSVARKSDRHTNLRMDFNGPFIAQYLDPFTPMAALRMFDGTHERTPHGPLVKWCPVSTHLPCKEMILGTLGFYQETLMLTSLHAHFAITPFFLLQFYVDDKTCTIALPRLQEDLVPLWTELDQVEPDTWLGHEGFVQWLHRHVSSGAQPFKQPQDMGFQALAISKFKVRLDPSNANTHPLIKWLHLPIPLPLPQVALEAPKSSYSTTTDFNAQNLFSSFTSSTPSSTSSRAFFSSLEKKTDSVDHEIALKIAYLTQPHSFNDLIGQETRITIYCPQSLWVASSSGVVYNAHHLYPTPELRAPSTELYDRLCYVLLFFRDKWSLSPKQFSAAQTPVYAVGLEEECLKDNREHVLLTLLGLRCTVMLQFKWTYFLEGHPENNVTSVVKDITYEEWKKLNIVKHQDMGDLTLCRKPLVDGRFVLVTKSSFEEGGTSGTHSLSMTGTLGRSFSFAPRGGPSVLYCRSYHFEWSHVPLQAAHFLHQSTPEKLRLLEQAEASKKDVQYVLRAHNEDTEEVFCWMGNKSDDMYAKLKAMRDTYGQTRDRPFYQRSMAVTIDTLLAPKYFIEPCPQNITLLKSLHALTTQPLKSIFTMDFSSFTETALVFDKNMRDCLFRHQWADYAPDREWDVWIQEWFPRFLWYFPPHRYPLQKHVPFLEPPRVAFWDVYDYMFLDPHIRTKQSALHGDLFPVYVAVMFLMDHHMAPKYKQANDTMLNTIQFKLASFLIYAMFTRILQKPEIQAETKCKMICDNINRLIDETSLVLMSFPEDKTSDTERIALKNIQQRAKDSLMSITTYWSNKSLSMTQNVNLFLITNRESISTELFSWWLTRDERQGTRTIDLFWTETSVVAPPALSYHYATSSDPSPSIIDSFQPFT